MARKDKTCPKCAAKVSRWDTVCIDCGGPLVPDEKEDDHDTAVTAGVVSAPAYGGAAAGMAEPGETSEKTRLRVFDQHLAEDLRQERPAIVVLTIISLVLALVLTRVAIAMLPGIGGLASFKEFDLAALRAKQFGMLVDPQVLFVVAAGLALAGYLCAGGEAVRFIAATRAISAVEAGQIPDVVGVTILTRAGLILAALLLPPLGIIMGVALKLSQSNELSELGGQMLYLALVVVGVVLFSIAWDAMADFAQARKPVSTAAP